MQPTAQPPAPPLLVALHHGHHNKTFVSPGKDCPDASYRNSELDALGLADHISTGFAWVACHLGPHPETGEVGWRNEDAYLASNVAALDIDGDLTLDAFWAIPFVQRHCLFTATSCSHNPADEHRFRAVFHFAPTADVVDLHRHIVVALEDAIGFSPKDTSGRKPERLWYGNDKAEIRYGGGQILPAELVFDAQDAMAEEKRRKAEPRPVASADQALQIRQATWLLESGTLPPSSDGQYNDVWLRVLAGAGCTGDERLWSAFLAWHQRGHHARKNSLRKCERERNKVRKSGVEAILTVAANILGKDWRRLLPPELKDRRRVIEPPNTLIRAAAPTTEESIELPAPAAPAPPPAPVHPEADPAGPKILVSAAVPDSLSMEDIRRFAAHEHGAGTTQTDADAMEDLIDRIYMLICHQLHKIDGRLDPIDDPEDVDRLLRFYRNQLFGYQLFARSPSELDRCLLQRFRRSAGTSTRRVMGIRAMPVGDCLKPAGDMLIPDLIEAGRTYLLYGKPGTGKSTFTLFLARAVVGTPGHRKFLDYDEVPAEAWRQRRVLIIGSDGGDGARGNYATYSNWHGMLGTEWQQHYLRLVSSSAEDGTPVWRMELQQLQRLIEILDEATREGIPYDLIIFDSLKAICPPGIYVGDQIITDYIQTIATICAARGVAQLYIHHQARDSDNPQGVAGLSEITDGNFQLKRDENGLHSFVVQKSRAEWNAHREIPYTISNGEIRAGMGGASTQQIDGEAFILRLIQQHIEEHRVRTSALPATSDARVYRALKPTEVWNYMEQKSKRHPEFTSSITTYRRLQKMLGDGTIVWTEGNRKQRGIIPAGTDPRTINSDQTELDAFTGYIEDPEEDDVP
mgnify:CR=1 FL=1